MKTLPLWIFVFTYTPLWASDLPSDWYQLPEDEAAEVLSVEPQSQGDPVGDLIDGVGQSIEPFATQAPNPNRWHLEAISTDLALTRKGLMGVLTTQGTGSVSVFWRRQGQKPTPAPVPHASEPTLIEAPPLHGDTHDEAAWLAGLDQTLRGAEASGQLKDRRHALDNLRDLAHRWRLWVAAIDSLEAGTSSAGWWVSGFRVDVQVDFQGNIHPIGHLTYIGGDLRLRWDFKRAQNKGPTPMSVATTHETQPIRAFLERMVADLDPATLELDPKVGPGCPWKAYAFRIGIGMSIKGDIVGVAKGSGSILGHVNFSRDVKKPVVYPLAPLDPTPLAVIEAEPSSEHVAWAETHGIEIARRSPTEAVYRVAHEKFRVGLKHALDRATKVALKSDRGKYSKRHWKPYEIKAGFDFSISGDLPLVTIGGLVASEVSIINTAF